MGGGVEAPPDASSNRLLRCCVDSVLATVAQFGRAAASSFCSQLRRVLQGLMACSCE
ncbi:hypothetical protein TRIATDRAFT_159984 [Trichoderma atroviride IMI 206040]|uniref:Uncharacterized protein n=1 Tax=Hypocrea atroviridis (strain ATCC 20476 / IMI 206040) TaxID=452589 RepID=G9NMR6_HYPAI|nr:uncharacterized protein TRIATDRAFT_159984 [Trichoderma atroviride IMI 206040]EHK48196.1 hypothetical protein TRIATDRAFT_159984 [Trichoderma atroviride IMI 206040]